ncbi:MAG: peptidoglycan DD-metalloendopeptidase family protein [Nitrospirales bacterium]|nr:peptidoglycan DD-metalloendopeptidase family protein [Nitrospirales bacterium]
MKHPDEPYTIMIFRGAMKAPLRVKLRKSVVRCVGVIGCCALVFQFAVLSHYMIQRSQVAELEVLQEEVAKKHKQTSDFSMAIDEMKQRMFTMQKLSRKLQTMFGLEASPLVDDRPLNGQGGQELPYESFLADEMNYNQMGQTVGDRAGKNLSQNNNEFSSAVLNIRDGLVWLDDRATRDQAILRQLEETSGKRVRHWASIPSIAPVKGPITSKFGPRVSPFTGRKTLHAGLDIGAPRGREVKAPAKGKVVVAAYDARMGNFIRIDHKYGIETTYGHLSKILVKYGQSVTRGDVIGLVGNTGKFSTGPHLHYQVAVNDKVVNPTQYILD